MISLKEKDFEKHITDQLVESGFILRGANDSQQPVQDKDYDRHLALDLELLGQFIQNTQPDKWDSLRKNYGDEALTEFAKRLDQWLDKAGALDILRQGVTDRGVDIDLLYRKPNSSHNPQAENLYQANLLSVMRQVYFSPNDSRSVDLVLFLNGIPIATFELKNQLTGQNVEHSMRQYKRDRRPTDKLFRFKRVLVHFAVDNNQAYMTTKINGSKTQFLPFNRGHESDAGNPPVEGNFSTHYLWDDVFSKDSLLEIIGRFMHLEVKKERNPAIGHTIKKETLLFPRYHQRDVVRKIVADVRINGAGKNYLIQHSAGSGKSNSIAWTAHHLSDLHDGEDNKVFDKVIIITDRRILDRQLRETVSQFEQQKDIVKGVTNSNELREALQDRTKIIVSTLQKFPVIAEDISRVQGKTFAVIVDEAHSSQTGESTKSLKQVLGKLEDAEKEDAANQEDQDPETRFALQVQEARGRLHNASFFAFTATPKGKTLEIFGQQGEDGKYYPFSLYSMKQAVNEGFILDVLQNYTTHRMYFDIAQKAGRSDPEFEKKKSHRLIMRYADLHRYGIEQKAELIVEHYRSQIRHLIRNQAKAMIVTKSRLHAIRYYLAVRNYLSKNNYADKALVAFSGTVIDSSRGSEEYTEAGLNGFSETQTAEKFDTDDYKFLIVANKYQAGFDQPKLAAMYVDKKLSGVASVQTLSRLNRTMGKDKESVFILDFVNSADSIAKDFQPYYRVAILSESTDPNILYDLKSDIMSLGVFDDEAVNQHYHLLQSGNPANQKVVAGLLDQAVQVWRGLDEDDQTGFRDKIRDFVRKYVFIAQLISFSDAFLEKLYEYLRNLAKKIPFEKDSLPMGLLEQIELSSIAISKPKKVAITLTDRQSEFSPMVGELSSQKPIDEFERLSLIIKSINEQFGLSINDGQWEEDAMLLVKRIHKREDVRKAIEHNPKEAAYELFKDAFGKELTEMFDERKDFYKTFDKDRVLKEEFAKQVFEELCLPQST